MPKPPSVTSSQYTAEGLLGILCLYCSPAVSCQMIKLMIHWTKSSWHDGNTYLQTETYFIRYIVIHWYVCKAYRKRFSLQYVGKHRVHRAKSSTHCQGKSWPYEQKLVLEGMEIADPGNLFYFTYNHVVQVQSIKSKQSTFCTFRQVCSSWNRCSLHERESGSWLRSL